MRRAPIPSPNTTTVAYVIQYALRAREFMVSHGLSNAERSVDVALLPRFLPISFIACFSSSMGKLSVCALSASARSRGFSAMALALGTMIAVLLGRSWRRRVPPSGTEAWIVSARAEGEAKASLFFLWVPGGTTSQMRPTQNGATQVSWRCWGSCWCYSSRGDVDDRGRAGAA
ncbi:hypothetical protein C8J57DRAFT_1362187, partial [Mycena rebaudengoi]